MNFNAPIRFLLIAILVCGLSSGCSTRPGKAEKRCGDEIVVAGQFFHTGTPVVLWMDPGGYDAYRVERRFSDYSKSSWRETSAENKLKSPNRYGLRASKLTPEQIEKVRGGGWDLPLLQSVVDQFVIHYDDCGVSRICFEVLQDERDLSVHFMLDVDGTIYQTLDLKEQAYHATTSNVRSVGIEVAHPGAYTDSEAPAFKRWYATNAGGGIQLSIPPQIKDAGIRTPGFKGKPLNPWLVHGKIQGEELYQYDYTPQQYAALTRLTASLCTIFPNIKCRYPTDAAGKLIPHKLDDKDLRRYQGVLGHFHVQTNKEDPGPAFDWDRVVLGARKLMHLKSGKSWEPADAAPQGAEGSTK